MAYVRGFAVKAYAAAPSLDFLDACDQGAFPAYYHAREGTVVYLPRLMGQSGDYSWDPLLEPGKDSSTRAGFKIPKELSNQHPEFSIETLEIGDASGEGDDWHINFGFVGTASGGEPWRGRRRIPSDNHNDWHPDSSGTISRRHKVGRVGITEVNLLSIDEAEIQIHQEHGVVEMRSNIWLRDEQVSGEVPTLHSNFDSWQLAIRALYDRIACGGCETLHFDNVEG